MRTCEIFENFAKIFTACQNSLIHFTRFWNIIWKSNSVLCTAFKNKKLKEIKKNYDELHIDGNMWPKRMEEIFQSATLSQQMYS